MRERYEFALKIACAALATLLLFQAVQVVVRRNPLDGLKIPALPVLAADSPDGAKGTNAPSAPGVGPQKTNAARADAKNTNSVSNAAAGKAGTNLVATGSAGKTDSNSIAPPQMMKNGTNSIPGHMPGKTETNASTGTASNRIGTNSVSGTNSVAGTNSAASTNSTASRPGARSRPDMAMMGGPFGRPGGKKAAELSPANQARVDKITDSEILGPVFRPQPMGLLGIAGNVAFLRAPNGQTGMVKEGDELGGVKLLRIGINRVLVEEKEEKKELMMFSGYGGETLMPKENQKTNEITKKIP